MNNHVTVLKIDGQALDHNLNYLKSKLHSNTKVLAVVKAFGYGSDGVLIANHLKEKVDYFAVAYAHEGAALREEGIENPILVLHPQIQNWDQIITHCLEPSIYNFKTLKSFLSFCDDKKLEDYPIHLKFNTGLNRLGFWHNDVDLVFDTILSNKSLKIKSVFSHLAASEDENEKDFTQKQISDFVEITKNIKSKLSYKPIYHMTNTSGIINYPEAHFDMVRTGIGLYGFGNNKHETSQLKNTHNLYSIISQIHQIEPGESVGYNRAFKAEHYMKTATIPIGHADGISRQLGNGNGYVTINNQKAAILGNVCMDMIMVNITDIECKEGDEVVVFNNQQTILDFAKACNSISYELLTAISQRIKRLFIQ